MPTLFVTGGCGFIGSNFVRHLLATDPAVRIVNFDALTYAGNLANLADLADNPRYRFVKGDITDRDGRAQAPCAGRRRASSTSRPRATSIAASSTRGPFVRTNVLGTQILLDAARESQGAAVRAGLDRRGVRHPRADRAVHRRHPAGARTARTRPARRPPTCWCGPTTTRSACTPSSPAARTTTGPYQFPEKLIPLFITNLIDDEPVPVYGDGLQVRDWIHVRDHCPRRRSRVAARARPARSTTSAAAARCPTCDLTHTLLDLLGKPQSLINYVQDRPGHDRRYAIDCSKAERELGWRPQVTFEHGLRETIDWYRANQPWVSQVRSGEYLKYYETQYGNR